MSVSVFSEDRLQQCRNLLAELIRDVRNEDYDGEGFLRRIEYWALMYGCDLLTEVKRLRTLLPDSDLK